MINMVYQDVWINGRKVTSGTRENCPIRYEILKNFFIRYKGRNIKILDLGANMGYFANRLAEDFPEFMIVTVEGRDECEIPLKMSEAIYPGVRAITKNLYVSELKELLESEKFDVAICLNVLHHVAEEYIKLAELFLENVDTLIMELYDRKPLPGIHDDRVLGLNDFFDTKETVSVNDWVDYDYKRQFFYLNDDELSFDGHPIDGFGTSTFSTTLWNKNPIEAALKHGFYPGTLNIELDNEIKLVNPPHTLDKNGFGEQYYIWPAFLFGYPVYIFHPCKEEFNVHVDLISRENLRNKFNLTNDSKVVLSIDKKYVEVNNGPVA